MKKIIVLLISIAASVLFLASAVSAEQLFTDVPEEFWASDEISYVVAQNMMSGYPDLSFHPNDRITKAEVAKVLVTYLGVSVSPVLKTSFSDVYASEWYAPYVEAGKGLFPLRAAFNGDHPFLPNHPAHREDVAYAIVVALGYASETQIVDESVLNMFSDPESISSDTRAYIAYAVSNKLVSGYPDGRFAGQDPLTRAEFAAMMYKAAKHGENNMSDPHMLEVFVRGEITPEYNTMVGVTRFAGNGEREASDNSDLMSAGFVSPASIACDENGNVYVADSGKLRVLGSGGVNTVGFDPSFIGPNVIEAYNGSLYFVSDPYEYDDGSREYAIVKKTGDNVELIYQSEAVYSRIFDISIYDGKMYFMQYNSGYDKNYLCEIDLNTNDYNVLRELDGGFKSIAVYDGKMYLANTENSYIARIDMDSINEEPEIYCGNVGDYRIVDGNDSRLFNPQKIICKDNYLYILDYNMVRRVPVMDSNWNLRMETLAGRFTAEKNPDIPREFFLEGWHRAYEVTFAPSSEMDFCFDANGNILVTDPKKSVIWALNLNAF